MSFKNCFPPSNDKIFCVYASSVQSTRDQFVRGHFFEGLKTSMENKSEGNDNKIILEDFYSTMDKMDRDGGKSSIEQKAL